MSAITFTPIAEDAVPTARRMGTRNGKFLAAFMASGHRAATVSAENKVTAGSLNQTAKAHKLPVKAKTVSGVVYVRRTDAVVATPAA